jgi:hypothetical protein
MFNGIFPTELLVEPAGVICRPFTRVLPAGLHPFVTPPPSRVARKRNPTDINDTRNFFIMPPILIHGIRKFRNSNDPPDNNYRFVVKII